MKPEKETLSAENRELLKRGSFGDLTEAQLISKKGKWKEKLGVFKNSEIFDEVQTIIEELRSDHTPDSYGAVEVREDPS